MPQPSQLQQVLSVIAALEQKMTVFCEMASESRRTLQGSNGNIGVVSKVNTLEKQTVLIDESAGKQADKIDKLDVAMAELARTVKIHIEDHAKREKNMDRYTWLIISTIIVNLLLAFLPRIWNALATAAAESFSFGSMML